MNSSEFGFLSEASEDGYELAGVIAFYQDPNGEDGAFKTFLTGEIPEGITELEGMQAFIMNVQAMMEEYLDSDIH
jgi:hypothetical protein